MKLPADIHLPFFAYGLFKPGQLCHFRIRDFVQSSSICTADGSLKERDGIPLFIPSKNAGIIKGYLISFIAGREDEAYDRIISIEPDEVYRWQVIKVNDTDANVLVGKRVDRGSSDLDHVEEWDGKSDPFFNDGIAEVEAILEANPSFDWVDYRPLFRLQMAYILLWSAVERYAGLKYHFGNNATEKVNRIADEKCFKDALEKIVTETREVYSTTKLDKYTLDPADPKKSINYYYAVRSNSVHRGKAVHRDFDTIKSSLTELLFIFKELLRDSFE